MFGEVPRTRSGGGNIVAGVDAGEQVDGEAWVRGNRHVTAAMSATGCSFGTNPRRGGRIEPAGQMGEVLWSGAKLKRA
jgi:hypothetical protein